MKRLADEGGSSLFVRLRGYPYRGAVQLGIVGPLRPLQDLWAGCRLLMWSLPPAERGKR